MNRARKEIAPAPSPAQAEALRRFERAYFGNAGATQKSLLAAVDAARARFHAHRGGKAPKKSGFSSSTYHLWRQQVTSPTLHDLEVLASICQMDAATLVAPRGHMDEALEEIRKALEPLRQETDRLVVAARIGRLVQERLQEIAERDGKPSNVSSFKTSGQRGGTAR